MSKKKVKPPVEETTIQENPQLLELSRIIENQRDQIQILTRQNKSLFRQEGIFSAMVDEMERCITPLPSQARPKISTLGKIVEHLVMHLSDEHMDEIVEPHKVGGLEHYNMSIAAARAEYYVDTTIKFATKTLSNYVFPVVWVLAYGDHVSGEIHDSVNHSEYRNMFRNALATGQIHALMLRELAEVFHTVKVVYLPGNHGRRSPKKDFHGARNSWDYLVAETARLSCTSIPNIEFLIPDAYSIILDINGHHFYVTHGDDVRSWNSIPFYGIERKTRRLIALSTVQGKTIECFVFGHFHQPSSIDAVRGETLINGTWVATSPYAYESLSSVVTPCQWIHGVHAKNGISWRMKVRIRHSAEIHGPKRYRVSLA